MQICCVFTSDLVIVMDKPPLESGPQEGNTENYSRSLHLSFCCYKNFYYENLALYGIENLFVLDPGDKLL